jgi:hypothetical protein
MNPRILDYHCYYKTFYFKLVISIFWKLCEELAFFERRVFFFIMEICITMDLVSLLRGLRDYRLRATDLEHNKWHLVLLKTNILSCLHQNVKIHIRLLSSMTTKSIFYYYSRIKY